MPVTLSADACRVLGCLVEKEATVPASYPLTINAVVTAANQSTGRDPLMHLDPRAAESALDELREAGLVRRVHASHGARVVKFRHVANEELSFDRPGLAVVALLLLRGPQTPGELRTRSERLHPFDSVDQVGVTLDELAARDEPLVTELPRRPGQKEQRWAHLLAGPVSDPADRADPAARAAQAREPEPKPIEIGPEVAALAPFVGHWVGAGAGRYPTIGDFTYTQEIDLLPIPGKPFLSYRSATKHATEHRPLHAESGFLRLAGDDGSVELVIAQGSGLVEIAEGILDDGELLLSSTLVGRSDTAKDVSATERRYRVEGDTLTYELAMEAVGELMTHHLQARLTRREPRPSP